MKKYTIREVEPEGRDFGSYFECDGLTERGGDFCNNLFLLYREYGHLYGFNIEEYQRIEKQAQEVMEGFDDVKHPNSGYNWRGYKSYKEVMEDCGIAYNSTKCHRLKAWAETAEDGKPESVAAFLSITTGKPWAVESVHGYSQGDYVEIVYCPEHYPAGVQSYGEIWLGCGKEFDVIEFDDAGNEVDRCGGYIVADCEARTDADYKDLVCNWAGIDEADTSLEMIEGRTTRTIYNYRTA